MLPVCKPHNLNDMHPATFLWINNFKGKTHPNQLMKFNHKNFLGGGGGGGGGRGTVYPLLSNAPVPPKD